MCTKAGLSWSGVVHVEGTGPAMDGARQIARRTAQQLTPHRWLPGTPPVPR